tara:strand:+ start:188 stop:700 length:513 start_codon:yes stop_codon:yes gene_type:complete
MQLWTFIISMMPVGELRFSIPFGIIAGLHWFEAFIYSFLGNSLIALILIALIYYIKIDNIQKLLNKIPVIGSIFERWQNRSVKRSHQISKWGYLGLTLFVGIPLPVTGAWTAVLIVSLLNLKPVKSFLYISLGLIISGTIVTIISQNFSNFMEYLFINKEDIRNFINSIS